MNRRLIFQRYLSRNWLRFMVTGCYGDMAASARHMNAILHGRRAWLTR